MAANDIWLVCKSYTPDFEWEEDRDAKNMSNKNTRKGNINKDSSSKGSKKDKKKEKNENVQTPLNETNVYCLVGSCNSIK